MWSAISLQGYNGNALFTVTLGLDLSLRADKAYGHQREAS
jgi:hypothetical protein